MDQPAEFGGGGLSTSQSPKSKAAWPWGLWLVPKGPEGRKRLRKQGDLTSWGLVFALGKGPRGPYRGFKRNKGRRSR